MEMGESAALIEQIAAIEHDDDCYFCKAEKPAKEDILDLDDEDKNYTASGEPPPDGVVFKNCAAKLGSRLRAAGDSPPELKPYIFAAHHLIPGNASFKKSDLFTSGKYMIQEGNKEGNIGYDINAAANGVWLPGNYGQADWSMKTESQRSAYAFKVMERKSRQFHDAHVNYNEFISDVLQKIYDKLNAAKDKETVLYCPESKDDETKPKRALKGLVARLNTVSRRMSGFLTGNVSAWRQNIYTSRFAPMYMRKVLASKTVPMDLG